MAPAAAYDEIADWYEDEFGALDLGGVLRHLLGVGATHRPLPELMHAFLAAGLPPERFAETGEPTLIVLAIKARKSAGGS
jgi:hypothetical protein